MKKIYFLFFLLLPSFTFSQNLSPLFLDGNTWDVKVFSYDLVDLATYESIESIYISGDTVFNGQSYKIISRVGGPHYGYGYDKDNKSFLRLPNDTTDILLYDFNLTVGDSFSLYIPSEVQSSGEIKIPVISAFSTPVDSNTVDKEIIFDFNPSNFPFWLPYQDCYFKSNLGQWPWLSGVGSLVHPLYPILACLEVDMYLDCFSQNGVEKYGYCSGVSVQELSHSTISLSPNPFDDQISVELEAEAISSIILYNSTGQLVAQSATNHLQDLENFPPGFYFLQVSLKKNNRSYVKKLIKR